MVAQTSHPRTVRKASPACLSGICLLCSDRWLLHCSHSALRPGRRMPGRSGAGNHTQFTGKCIRGRFCMARVNASVPHAGLNLNPSDESL